MQQPIKLMLVTLLSLLLQTVHSHVLKYSAHLKIMQQINCTQYLDKLEKKHGRRSSFSCLALYLPRDSLQCLVTTFYSQSHKPCSVFSHLSICYMMVANQLWKIFFQKPRYLFSYASCLYHISHAYWFIMAYNNINFFCTLKVITLTI
jgi:hypothetical protein